MAKKTRDIEDDFDELEALEGPEESHLTVTFGPSVTPVVPSSPSTGLPLTKAIVEDARSILGLDDLDLDLKQKLFLVAYATYGTPSAACKAVGISPMTHNKWLKDSELYAEVFQAAFDVVTDKIEQTSLQASLIVENVKERIFHLENRRPERYAKVKKVAAGGDDRKGQSLAELARQAYLSGSMEED